MINDHHVWLELLSLSHYAASIISPDHFSLVLWTIWNSMSTLMHCIELILSLISSPFPGVFYRYKNQRLSLFPLSSFLAMFLFGFSFCYRGAMKINFKVYTYWANNISGFTVELFIFASVIFYISMNPFVLFLFHITNQVLHIGRFFILKFIRNLL